MALTRLIDQILRFPSISAPLSHFTIQDIYHCPIWTRSSDPLSWYCSILDIAMLQTASILMPIRFRIWSKNDRIYMESCQMMYLTGNPKLAFTVQYALPCMIIGQPESDSEFDQKMTLDDYGSCQICTRKIPIWAFTVCMHCHSMIIRPTQINDIPCTWLLSAMTIFTFGPHSSQPLSCSWPT